MACVRMMVVFSLTIFVTTWFTPAPAAAPEPLSLRILARGVLTLPSAVTTSLGHDVPIRGLSGITQLGADRFAAIMDNSDTILLFSLSSGKHGLPMDVCSFEVVTLAETHDYEDIALCPPPLLERIRSKQIHRNLPDPGQCLLVAEEDTPAIRAVSLAHGTLLGIIPIPEILSTRRPNRGLESLALDPDGCHVWTANEEAVPADGPTATPAAGTVVRLTRIAIPKPEDEGRSKPFQFTYAVEPPHDFIRLLPGNPLSGVSAIAALGDGQLLILERSGCPGLPAFENRLFLVDASEAAASQFEGVPPHAEISLLPKTLLWREQLGCNVEGLCFVRRPDDSAGVIIMIADNGGTDSPNHVVWIAVEFGPAIRLRR